MPTGGCLTAKHCKLAEQVPAGGWEEVSIPSEKCTVHWYMHRLCHAADQLALSTAKGHISAPHIM